MRKVERRPPALPSAQADLCADIIEGRDYCRGRRGESPSTVVEDGGRLHLRGGKRLDGRSCFALAF